MTFEYRNLIVADTHVGHDQALPVGTLLGFLDHVVVRENVVLAGDTVEDFFRRMLKLKGRYRGEEVATLQAYLCARRDLNCVRLPGNHDRWPEEWPESVYGYAWLPQPWRPFEVAKGVLVVHGHENNHLWRVGELRTRLAPRLWPNAAKKASNAAARRVMRLSRFDRKLADMALGLSARMVVHGHWHAPEVRELDGVTLVGVPDWQKHAGGAVVQRLDDSWAMVDRHHRVLRELGAGPHARLKRVA